MYWLFNVEVCLLIDSHELVAVLQLRNVDDKRQQDEFVILWIKVSYLTCPLIESLVELFSLNHSFDAINYRHDDVKHQNADRLKFLVLVA